MSLAGVWQNEYGSTMSLSLLNPNRVSGIYKSSTGSTGTYRVVGFQTSAEPTPTAGQAVSLAIEWHSVDAGPPDNSWHWVSGLSGQISIQNGVEQLVLSHAMVASIEFPGLADAGTYIDKLIYKRVGAQAPAIPSPPAAQKPLAADPMLGNWFAGDGTALLISNVIPYAGNAFGLIEGKLTRNGGVSSLGGVTDINAAPDGLPRQSAAIIGLPSDAGGPAISYAGTLDLRSGVLTMLELDSQSTAPGSTYVQTLISSKTFKKG